METVSMSSGVVYRRISDGKFASVSLRNSHGGYLYSVSFVDDICKASVYPCDIRRSRFDKRSIALREHDFEVVNVQRTIIVQEIN